VFSEVHYRFGIQFGDNTLSKKIINMSKAKYGERKTDAIKYESDAGVIT
jgi:hypothetical protein